MSKTLKEKAMETYVLLQKRRVDEGVRQADLFLSAEERFRRWYLC